MLRISDTLKLPAEAMTLTSAVLGIRGSGKTNTAVVFTEELLDEGQQVIIIDPLDVWFGLKSSADGKAPGYPIIVLGGVHSDLPLNSGDGRVLADFLVETRAPTILSLRHLRKHEQRSFVTDFAEQLYQRKGESGKNTPVLIVIDEASSFVPQSFQGGEARMVGAIEDLVRRGRASGIGVMLIDQRAASVNKDVLTQLELLIAHRHTSPQDRNALKLWVQAHDTGDQEKAFMESLASLPRGTAWFWAPGWLDLFKKASVRVRRTFDSSATPELGKAVAAPEKLAEVDLEALRGKLAATIEQAKADDPKALRAEIQSLQKQLAEAKQTQPAPEPIGVPVPLFDPRDLAQLGESAAALKEEGERFAAIAGAISKTLDSALCGIQAVREPVARSTPEPPVMPPSRATPTAPARSAPPAAKAQVPPSDLSVSHLKVLNALAALERLGVSPVTRINVAFFAGYTENGHFNNMCGTLKTNGYLNYPQGGMLALTDKGRAQAAADAHPIRSLADLHRVWLEKVSPSEAKLLGVLIHHYPDAISRPQLAQWTGYTENGHFNNMVGHLRTLGVVDYPRGGHVMATGVLFPAGLK